MRVLCACRRSLKGWRAGRGACSPLAGALTLRRRCCRRRMSEAKTYTGGCHCGKVRYEVTTDLAHHLCNCSICSKKAYLLTFVRRRPVPAALRRGRAHRLPVQQDEHPPPVLHDVRHPVVRPWDGARRQPMYSINVRCLDDVDVSELSDHRGRRQEPGQSPRRPRGQRSGRLRRLGGRGEANPSTWLVASVPWRRTRPTSGRNSRRRACDT